MNNFSNVKVLVITANIAAGKSSLLERIKQRINDPRIKFLPEPTKEWENTFCQDGKNILEKYYSDPLGWSFKFQLNASLTREEALERTILTNPGLKVIVSERSSKDDRNIFAAKLKDDGYISEDEMMLIDRFGKRFASKLDYLVKHVVHLKTSVETCLGRRIKRMRNGEEGVGLELLSTLLKKEQEYIDLLVETKGSEFVIELDGNLEHGTPEYEDMVFEFANFVKKLANE